MSHNAADFRLSMIAFQVAESWGYGRLIQFTHAAWALKVLRQKPESEWTYEHLRFALAGGHYSPDEIRQMGRDIDRIYHQLRYLACEINAETLSGPG